MKRILIITLQLLTLGVFAQAPQLINYQGVARNASGVPISNRTLGIKFEIFQGSSVTAVFTETNVVVTNNLGLFTTQIGKVNTAGIGNIDFGAGALSLKIGVDSTGGSNFVNMGTQSLVSVPFSMYAASVPASYTNNILTIGKSTFTLNTGNQAIYTSSTGISIISSSIITNTLPDQTVTIVPGNSNVNVTGTYPNFTIAATPTLGITGNSLTISGGNTVALPASSNASLVGSGAANVTTLSSNSFSVNVPPTNIASAGAATVSGTYPNYTVSAPAATPNTTLTGAGSATVSGTFPNYTVNTPAATPSTNLSGTGAATVTGTFPNYTVSAPAATPSTNLQSGGSATVTGTFPNYTVSAPAATPSTNLQSGGSATVTGTFPNYTVSAPAATPSTNLQSGGSVTVTGTFPNYTVSAPAATPSTNLQSGGSATVTGTFPNYTVSAPAATASTNLQAGGSATVSGAFPNYTVSAPAATASTNLQAGGSASVTGTFPNYTVSAPAATPSTGLTQSTNVIVSGAFPNYTIASTPTLSLIGNNLGISGGNTLAIPSNTIVALTTTIQTGGAAILTTFGANDYSIHVPNSTLTLNGDNLSVNGGNTVTIAPTLSVTGNVLSVGPTSNTVTLPSGPTLVGAGAATVTGGPNYTVNAPAATPSTNITGAGSATVTGTFPNYTVSAPAAAAQVAQTITPQGAVTVTNGVNSFTVNAPAQVAQTITPQGAVTVTTGINSFTIGSAAAVAQTLVPQGAVTVTNGVNSFTVSAPAQVTQTITPQGAVTVTTGINSFTIGAPAATAQTITPQGIVTVTTGVNSFTVGAPAQTIVPQGAVTVTNGVNSFTVNAPAQVAQTITPQGAVTLTTGVNSFTIGAPAAAAQTITPQGIVTVTTGVNSFTVGAPAQTIVPQGAVTVTNGVNSFTVNAPAQVTQTITPQGAVTVTTGINSFTIGAPAAAAQTITPQGIVTVTTGVNSFTVGAPAQTIVPQGAVTVTNGVNSFTVNAPAQVAQTITPQGAVTLTTGVNSFTIGAPAATAQTITPQGIVTVTTGVNSFTVGAPAQTIVPQGAVTVTNGVNSFTVNAPAQVTQTITPQGAVTVTTGVNSFTVGAPAAVAQTIVPQGAVTVTNGVNSFTVSAPAQVAQTITPQGAVTVTAGVNSFTIGASSAVPQTITPQGIVTVTTGANSFTVGAPAQTIVPQGAVTVTNGINSFTVNAPAQVTQTITPQGAVTVTTGVNSFTVGAPAAVAQTIVPQGAVTVTNGVNSFTVSAPAQVAQTITPQGAVTVTTGVNSFTIGASSAVPQTITPQGIVTVTTGANSFTVGAPAQTIVPQGAVTVTNGVNSFTVNAPAQVTQTITPQGAVTVTTGVNSFTVGAPAAVAQTIVPQGAVTVTNGANSFTVSAPAQIAQTITPQGALTVTNGVNSFTISGPAATPTTVILGTGAVVVTSVAPNNFTVDVPITTVTQGTNIAVSGSYPNFTVSALPTLALNSGSLLSISGGNTVTIPATNISLTTGTAAAASISTVGLNNFSLNIPSAITPTITPSGVLSRTATGSSFTLDVPAPVYVAATGALNTGTASVNITPLATFVGTVLTVGPTTNTVGIPFTQTTSIIGTGAALVTSNTAANYTVDVPQTSLTQSTNISINGSFPSYTISALPTLALASGSVLSISGGNSVVFPGLTTMAAAGVATVSAGPNYTVGVPASNIAMTFSAGAAGVSTTSANNFNLNIPSPNIAVTQTAGAAGITTVSANSYNINIPAPTYVAATGALNSGTASVNITQALSISGNTITSGPASNSISLSLITNTLWSTVGNAGTSPATNFIGTTDAQDLVVKTSGTEQMRVTTAGKVGIGSNAPSENLQVETGGNTAVSILGSSSSVANIGFGLTGGNHTMGNIRYNNSNNSFNLWTNNTANRLVIDNAGLVGIGLATPTYPLHVNGDVKANYLHGDVINDAGTLQSLRLRGNGSVLFVADDNNDDVSSGFTWYNNGEAALNIQMLLDNSGNLGIGNALPTQRVDITGNLKFSGALMPNNLPGTSGYILTSAGAGVAPTWQNPNGLSWGLLGNSLTSTVTNFVGTTDNVGLAFRTNNAIRMSILNTGNVTVGTPSNPEPDGLLNVVSNNAAVNGLNGVFLDIQNSSNTTNNLTGIRFTGSSAANWYTKTAILVPYTNGSFGVSDMIFALNNVNAIGAVSTADAKMIIKSNGNVGIGTTAPNFYSGTGRYLSVSASTVYSANQTAALELEGSSISGVVPTAKLDFNSVGPPNTPTVTGRLSLYPSAANGIYGGDLAFSTYNGSTLGERMRISDNGKIGINTSAPDATLSIEGSFDAGTGNTVTNALSFAMGVSNNVTGVGSGAIGSFNTVAGNRAFGFGNFVSVPNLGSVAFGDWSGGSPTTLASSTSDEFSARFSNGYRFFTDPALTPSLGVYISSAGKVGIGTATPADRFSVYGSKFSVSDGPHLSFTTDEDIYPVSYMLNWGHNEQWLMFNGYYDGSFRSSSTVGNYAITNQTSGSQALIFKTNQGTAPGSSIGTWTNALAISGAGFVGIGLVAPLYQLHVEKNNAGTVAFFDNNSTAGGTCLLAQVNTNSLSAGTRMAIDAQTRFGNGTGYGINATSWYNSATNYGVYGYGYGGTGAYGVQGQAGGTAGTCYGILGSAFGSGTNYAVYASGNLAYTGALQSISDQRFKDDIQPLTGALDKLMKLQPKTYNMKVAEYDYMNFSKTRQFGLIAQEVEEVLPELVEKGVNPGPVDAKTREPLGEEITFKTMNYLGLTPVIIQAIKEQQQQIEDLKKVVAEQQKQIDQLLKK